MKASGWTIFLRVLLALGLIISLAAGGLFAYGLYTYSKADSVRSTEDLGLPDPEQDTDGVKNILLVGSDSRTDAQGNELSSEDAATLNAGDDDSFVNTDTIIILNIPDDGSAAKAVSIPRDTYVSTGEGNMKINGVYAAGRKAEDSGTAGRRALISAVQQVSSVKIDHYAEVGLLGFKLFTDAVGGVDVCLNNDVYDEFSGADFSAGQQTLDGEQSLSFVRQRHGLPNGDLDRVARQQAYLASLSDKLLSAPTLANPARLNDLTNALQDSVLLDDRWSLTEIFDLARKTQGNVEFSTIPVTSIDGRGDNGESVVTIDRQQVKGYFDSLFDTDDTSEGNTGGTEDVDLSAPVNIINGTSVDGLTPSVSRQLSNRGFTIGEMTTDFATSNQESQILTPDTDNPVAQALSDMLSLPIAEDRNVENVTVSLTAGYSGPGSVVEPDDSDPAAGSAGTAIPTPGPAPTTNDLCVN